jgi:uncharacterized membrane protein
MPKSTISRFFIITAFIFGTLYAVIVPPFQVPDEFNHFFKTYQITEGVMLAERTSENRVGGYLPQSLDIVSKPFRHLPFHKEHKTSHFVIQNLLNTPLNEQNRIFFDFPNTGLYAPTAYLPQVVIVSILKKINCPPLYMLYATRLVTLYFWIFLVSFALRITPIARGLLAFLALLPASLFISAGNNADVISNGLSFIVIAYILRGVFSDTLFTTRDYWILGICFSLLTVNKIVYFPFVFLLFLGTIKNASNNETLPNNSPKVSNFWRVLRGFGTISISYIFLLTFLNIGIIIWWLSLIRPLQITYNEYHTFYRTILPQPLNEKVNHLAQLDFIVHNPLIYSKILIFSVLKSAPHTLIHYLGKFGWEKNYFPHILNFSLLMLLILSRQSAMKPEASRGASESVFLEKRRHNMVMKGSFITIGLMMVATVATFLYLNSCEVGGDFIYNLSGKYFFPIFPLFFLAFSIKNKDFNGKILRGGTTDGVTTSHPVSKNILQVIAFLQKEWLLKGVLIFNLIYGVYAVLERYY